jgi:hypothetical protein
MRQYGILALFLAAGVGSAAAAPVLVGSTTDATGINNLNIDGSLYDVSFTGTSPSATFTGTQLTAAGTDLAAALNTLHALYVDGVISTDLGLQLADSQPLGPNDSFLIASPNPPLSPGWSFDTTQPEEPIYATGPYYSCPMGATNCEWYVDASFTPVPIPAAGWLLLSAFGGLLGLGRKRLTARR